MYDIFFVPLTIKDFFEALNNNRAQVSEKLRLKYLSISPLLIKIESFVTGTSTGHSKILKQYYQFWEKKMLVALTMMVVNNVRNFERHLNKTAKGQVGKTAVALFKISAILSSPEIVTMPSPSDLYKIMIKFSKSIVESTKQFVRWRNGSCILVLPQKVIDSDEPFIFSFHPDIIGNHSIINAIHQLHGQVSDTFNSISKWLETWKKYRPLWKVDKTITLEKFIMKNPNIILFDEKLGFYAKLASDVQQHVEQKDVDFISINSLPLQVSIHTEARNWVMSIGKCLNEIALEKLVKSEKLIAVDSLKIEKSPDTIEDLTNVLATINDIKTLSHQTELQIARVHEKYRTLLMYAIPVSADEIARKDDLIVKHVELCAKANQTELDLQFVKTKFSSETEEHSTALKAKIVLFGEEFMYKGPATFNNDLDAGYESLEATKAKLKEYQGLRDELVRSERLFDLSVTNYPELIDIQTQLNDLQKIYDLYKECKDTLDSWAKTSWSHIDFPTMTRWTEEYGGKLRKLSKEIKQLAPYNAVALKLTQFKDSLPLFQQLKSEALRERHWRKLMEVTQKSFDSNTDSLSLGKLMAMNLHERADAISDIVLGASKELSIENALKLIEQTWRTMKFSILKYTKGTEERGLILGSVEEIILALDDNSMSLQSMGASRFVTAFIEVVQKWEKSLSKVSECIDVWLIVQRKYMYLESIFVGSPDIRMQLPQEAIRFDKVDSAFKLLMNDTSKNPTVLESCLVENRYALLESLSEELESCQKSLSEYLESKRNTFPRFFFISDEELLSILGSFNPTNVQEHIVKMFDNVVKLNFGTGKFEKYILGMTSGEGEILHYKTPVQIHGKVEEWMGMVEAEMKASNRSAHKEAIFNYALGSRLDWIAQFPGMVGLAASQCWWTWEVEDVFRKIGLGQKLEMKLYYKTLVDQLNDLVAKVRTDLSSNDRKKINTQIVIDVHARDVIDRFVRDSIMSDTEFEWESQLRFYWNKTADNLLVSQCNGTFSSGYEYMGLNGRLVITPLTDRCFLTITQALSMMLGAAPAGI